MNFDRRTAVRALALLLACGLVSCAAPIVPQRSKPGGSARWAEAVALQKVTEWSADAELCRITGAGVGADGWLPDRGGIWTLYYWSPQKQPVLEASVDSDGGVRTRQLAGLPQRGRGLPEAWRDSPTAWAATRAHQKDEPVSTFDAELASDAEPERFPGQSVWRIRFWEQDGSSETHVVSAMAKWMGSY